MEFGNLPSEMQSTILFESRTPSLSLEQMSTTQLLKEQLILTSPLKRDEFLELFKSVPCVSISSIFHRFNRTLHYDTRSHITGIKGDRIQCCFVIIHDSESIEFSTAMTCEKHKDEFKTLKSGQDVPFLTSAHIVFDTKSVLYVLSSRCNKVGIPFKEEFILNYFNWVCENMSEDPIRLFSYMYSELVLRGYNVTKYHSLLFKDIEPVDSQSEYHETDIQVPITEELKENCKSCLEEMKSLVCKYLKFEMSLM